MLAGPPNLPSQIVMPVADAMKALLQHPGLRASLEKAGLDVTARGPDQLAARIANDERMWTEIVKSTGLTSN
jgi:tripartite-type tricarboxylate transporter receptor subunit TctC